MLSLLVRCVSQSRDVSLGRAILAGLAGSLVNTMAIRLAQLSPVPPGIRGLSQLTLAITNGVLHMFGTAGRLPANFGPVGQEIFHTGMGLLMALVYAFFFYRCLPGPGWVRGLLFCQLAWLIQVVVVLPQLGAGVLGLRLSPLTPMLSFALNALYGVTLGVVYSGDRSNKRAGPSTSV